LTAARGWQGTLRHSVEEVAVALHVRGQIERMLTGEPFGELHIAALESFDDLEVIDDRARGAVVLRDRGPSDARTWMNSSSSMSA